MQAWGLPSVSLVDSMKVANSYSGYIKREHSADSPLLCKSISFGPGLHAMTCVHKPHCLCR